MKQICLAGGCFWGIQDYFANIEGVTKIVAGYANSTTGQPTYKQVCTGTTNAAEAVLIDYNSSITSLEQILNKFFDIIDPTTLNYQGVDHGTQYRSGVYYKNEDDNQTIIKAIQKQQQKYTDQIVTEVESLNNFTDAEEYHQMYFKKNNLKNHCHAK